MRTIHAAMLAGCLCCTLMPAYAKDAGWQWYNEKLKSREEEQLPAPAASPPQMDILEKQAALQHATKKALAEAIYRLGRQQRVVDAAEFNADHQNDRQPFVAYPVGKTQRRG